MEVKVGSTLGATLMICVVCNIWLNRDYGSVTDAMYKKPLIGFVLTIGICLMYTSVIDVIHCHNWEYLGMAVGIKPLSTIVAYSGVVLTVDAKDSALHLSFAWSTFAGMSTDLLLIGVCSNDIPVIMCAIMCTGLVVAMVIDTKLKHLKNLELMFGIVFPVGVMLSGPTPICSAIVS